MSTIDARQIQKISTVGGQIPTVAPSNNHKDGTWTVTDCYSGEILVNEADGKVYALVGTVVVELGSSGTVDLATVLSNGNTTGANDIVISLDSVIEGASGETSISMGETGDTDSILIKAEVGASNTTQIITPNYTRTTNTDGTSSSYINITTNTTSINVDTGANDAITSFTDEGLTVNNSTSGEVFRVNSVGMVITNSITPTGSADTVGEEGQITFDSDYIYVKTSAGWKRSTLTSF